MNVDAAPSPQPLCGCAASRYRACGHATQASGATCCKVWMATHLAASLLVGGRCGSRLPIVSVKHLCVCMGTPLSAMCKRRRLARGPFSSAPPTCKMLPHAACCRAHPPPPLHRQPHHAGAAIRAHIAALPALPGPGGQPRGGELHLSRANVRDAGRPATLLGCRRAQQARRAAILRSLPVADDVWIGLCGPSASLPHPRKRPASLPERSELGRRSDAPSSGAAGGAAEPWRRQPSPLAHIQNLRPHLLPCSLQMSR